MHESRDTRGGEAEGGPHEPERLVAPLLAEPAFQDRIRAAVQDYVRAESSTLFDWFAELGRDLVAEAVDRLARDGRLQAWLSESALSLFSGADRPGRAWLEELVSREVAREVRAIRARDEIAWGDWTKGVALEGAAPSVPPLPCAREHRERWAYTEIPEGLLEHDLERHLEADPFPLPNPAEREGYCAHHHFDYWLSGLIDFAVMRRILRERGLELDGARVMDLGCASGRVARHALCQARAAEVWAADINRRHVEWVSRHLPSTLKAFQCSILPSLPLADASLDLLYAFSVFTHVDEFETAWLAELRRIVRPGGYAYLTIHSDETWRSIDLDGALYRSLYDARESILEHRVSPELFRGPLPEPKTVFLWRSATNNNTSVFHSTEYVRDRWGRFFEVCEIRRRASDYQDAVVLRRR